MIYYIYHIPGIKVGVTTNLEDRVEVTQGYGPGEYEILAFAKDINIASKLEVEFQKEYGYKIDRDLYKDVVNKNKNKMKLNPTEQTTTFPCPVNKLKGQLLDNKGLKWETPNGYSFELTDDVINWIVLNAKESMYNMQRSYVYNKALYEYTRNLKLGQNISPSVIYNKDQKVTETIEKDQLSNVYNDIRAWALERGIYDKGDSKTQYVKLMEEAGELARAIIKRDEPEIKDAIGDMVVVLTNLAKLEGMFIEDCVESAYNVIANRKGKMENGSFVKETL